MPLSCARQFAPRSDIEADGADVLRHERNATALASRLRLRAILLSRMRKPRMLGKNLETANSDGAVSAWQQFA